MHLFGLLILVVMLPFKISSRRLVAGALALAVCASLSACQTAGERLAEEAGQNAPTASDRPTASIAEITIAPAEGAVDVAPDVPVTVTASNGQLSAVEVAGPSGAVAGSLTPDRATWTSTAPLALGASYTVAVTAVDPYGLESTMSSTFTTLTPADANRLDVSMSPLEGETVGAGMPVVLYLSDPVVEDYRAAVEAQVSVTSTPPVEGAWSWINDEELHWRPRELWPGGTTVSVDVDIEGVRAGEALWGGQPLSDRPVRTFMITPKATNSVVDLTAKTLSVYQDGALARAPIPITGGKPGWETRGGTKVILEKFEQKTMDAATLGVDPNDPEYYSLTVDYALRVTWSGEFIHSAPWSVGQQGEALVSHGCVGMSEADAAWFYDITTKGDIVTVTGSPKALEPGNGYTDWNLSWDQWLAGSAIVPSAPPTTTSPPAP